MKTKRVETNARSIWEPKKKKAKKTKDKKDKISQHLTQL